MGEGKMPALLGSEKMAEMIGAYLNGKLGRGEALEIRRRVMADPNVGQTVAKLADLALQTWTNSEGDSPHPDISTVKIDYWYQAIARDYRLHALLSEPRLAINANHRKSITRQLKRTLGRHAFLPDFREHGLEFLGLRSIKHDRGTVIAVYHDLAGHPLTLSIFGDESQPSDAKLLESSDINLMAWTDGGCRSILAGWQSPATLDRIMKAIWPAQKPYFDASQPARLLASNALS